MDQETREIGRRALIKALGVGAGAAALGSKWAKPIVDSVVLPLHAQGYPVPLSYFIGCVASPETGSQVEAGGDITVTVTLAESATPDPLDSGPSVGREIFGRITCDGTESFNGSIGFTNDLGQVVYQFTNECEPGQVVAFQATFNVPPADQPPSEVSTDPSEECFWMTSETCEPSLSCVPIPEAGSVVDENQQLQVTITVLCGETPVANEAVSVRLLCNGGEERRNIFPFDGMTDSNGQVVLNFAADPTCPFGQEIRLWVQALGLSENGCYWMKRTLEA